MKSILLLIFLIGPLTFHDQAAPKFYASKQIKTTIYSEAPVENIEATSVGGIAILNTETGEIQFSIPIRSFEFRKKLMQEHFNENYMESDKYPNAKFKGKIGKPVDFTMNGTYKVVAEGELEVHGVKQRRAINGVIEVDGNTINISSSFDTKCADHKIKIPQLVFRNIAETIRVTVSGSLKPYNQSQS